MILYRKEPYPLQMKNIILLDDVESGGVVYVNKATYDQALLLHSRFDGNISRIIGAIKNKKTEAYIVMPGLSGMIDKMAKTMPEPLNALAPFLMLCTQNSDIDWTDKSREFAYGVLHQFSQLVDFNAMTLVPAEVRLNVSIPTSILKQYEVSWNDLCSTLEDKVVLAPKQVVTEVVKEVAAPQVTAQPVSQPAPVQPTVAKPAEPVKEEEPEMSELEKKLLAIRKKSEARDKEIAKAPTPAPKPAAKPTAPSGNNSEAAANTALLNEYDI